MRSSRLRFLTGGLAAVLLALLASIASAGPASAHAVLISSSPGEGERLPRSPSEVTVSFSEDVTAGLGGLAVYASDGSRVDVGTPFQPNDSQVRVDLRPDLPSGTYVASYRVVSADGHPVSGAVVFAVGDVLDASSVAGIGGSDGMATPVGAAGRILTYLGALLAAGLAVFVAFVHDGGPERRRIVVVARIAGLVAVVGTVLVVTAQASLATGRGLGVVTDTEVLSAVLEEAGLGWSVAVLFAGLALLHIGVGSANAQVRQGFALYGGLVTCGSFLIWGHSRSVDQELLAGAADLVHVSVAALWLGGLAGLAATLRSRSDAGELSDAVDSAHVVLRFSTVAAYSVVVLWLSGSTLAWTIGEDLPASLTEEAWGRWLLAKAALVAAVLVIALWNRRRLVPSLLDAADEAEAAGPEPDDAPGAVETAVRADPSWSLLKRTVLAELAILVLVVFATAGLVNTPPGAGSGGGVFDATLPVDDRLQVQVLVSPADNTTNAIHVSYLDEVGRPADAAREVTLRATLVDPAVGPIEIPLAKGGPGHYLATTDALAIPGTWELELVTKLDEFTAERTTVSVPISAA